MNATAPSLTRVRRFRAPPARVWAAWTQPGPMVLWFGPHNTRAEHADADTATRHARGWTASLERLASLLGAA